MTLADALHALAVAGCRLAAGPDGGMTLDVPPGAELDRAVLDVLAANREAVAAALTSPAPPAAADLAEYLASKGLEPGSVDFVLAAAEAFDVQADAITIEAVVESSPVFFEPGIPCTTTIDTQWHEPGRGYFTIPAGAFALRMPQAWAVADDFERNGLEAILASLAKHNTTPHAPVWLAGRARVLPVACLDFQNVAAPDGTDFLPWRSPTPVEIRCP